VQKINLLTRAAHVVLLLFGRQVADFTFEASNYVTDYITRAGPIKGNRPHQLPLNCTKHKFSTILSGAKRQQPAKIVWASRFSFETHMLLLRLHTYKDLVDNFFISESSRLAITGESAMSVS
jgi:hypothetical protein